MNKITEYPYDFKDVQMLDFKMVLEYLGVPTKKETEKELFVDLKGDEIKIIKEMNRYFIGNQVQNVINFVETYRGCKRYEAGLELYNQFTSLVDSYKKIRENNELIDNSKVLPKKEVFDLDDLILSDKNDEKNINQIIQLKPNQIIQVQMLDKELNVTNTMEIKNI